MEDYTYHLVLGEELILGAHLLEVSPSLATTRPTLEIHPIGIGGRDDPVRLLFTADPGHAVVAALSDMRDRFRLTVNAVHSSPRPRICPTCPSAAPSGNRNPTSPPAPPPGSPPVPPTTP